jgi:iron-sulfur cluster repair protein YtfE (RIC family)
MAENRLQQRLICMENAAARLNSLRMELRKNADLAQLDIASAIDHQMNCLRAREKELLRQLNTLVNAKEERLNKAIGGFSFNSLDLLSYFVSRCLPEEPKVDTVG